MAVLDAGDTTTPRNRHERVKGNSVAYVIYRDSFVARLTVTFSLAGNVVTRRPRSFFARWSRNISRFYHVLELLRPAVAQTTSSHSPVSVLRQGA
jgi:hypothetical protein